MRGNAFRLLPALVLCTGLHQAFAQGTAFTYQGRLNDGGNAANGSYDLTFKIYDSTNDPGNLVAGPLTNSAVGVSNGLFTVTLDFGDGVFDGNPRWLEIDVRTNGSGPFATLNPRQALLPAPYAIAAGNLIGSATNQVNSAVQAATNTFIGTVTNIVIGQGYVTASITNGLATTNYVNTITNGLATTNYVTAATTNLGNTVAVTMTNAANQFVGSFTGNGGGLTNVGGITFVASTTNVFYLSGAGSDVNGTFWNGDTGTSYTNFFNSEVVIFSLSSIWLLESNEVAFYWTTNLIGGTWALVNGQGDNPVPSPISQWGYFLNGNGGVWYGLLSSTNMTAQINSAVQTVTNNLMGTVGDFIQGATNNLLTTVNANIQSGTNSVLVAVTNLVQSSTNNFGKTTAVAMTNAANQFTGTFTGNGGGLTNITAVSTNIYAYTALQPITAAIKYTFPHGLTHTPYFYRVQMVCTNNDASQYVVGDVLEWSDVVKNSVSGQQWCDATNVYLSVNGSLIENWSSYYVVPAGGGVAQNLESSTNWNLRAVAQ